MKKLLLVISGIGIAFAACTHQQPAPQSSERSLDDAELRQYQKKPSTAEVGGLRKTVTLGKGEVDLSNWKSSEERAAEASEAENGAAASAGADVSTPVDAVAPATPSIPASVLPAGGAPEAAPADIAVDEQ